MTDERLRRLERTWRETGTVEAEAILLREKVRFGLLARDMVALAAHLGHPAARDALDLRSPAPPPPTAEQLSAFVIGDANDAPIPAPPWIAETQRLGGDLALRRLATSALRLSPWCASMEALDAVEAWIVSPTELRLSACRPHLAGDAAIIREVAKLVLTWGGGVIAGRDVVVATCRTLDLCFADDPVRQSGIALGTRELIAWSLSYADAQADRASRKPESDARPEGRGS